VRQLLSIEHPFKRSVWVLLRMVFFEQANCSVFVAASEVLSIIGDDHLGDCVTFRFLGCFQRLVHLLELARSGVHNFDLSVILGNEDFLAVGSELDAGEDLSI